MDEVRMRLAALEQERNQLLALLKKQNPSQVETKRSQEPNVIPDQLPVPLTTDPTIVLYAQASTANAKHKSLCRCQQGPLSPIVPLGFYHNTDDPYAMLDPPSNDDTSSESSSRDEGSSSDDDDQPTTLHAVTCARHFLNARYYADMVTSDESSEDDDDDNKFAAAVSANMEAAAKSLPSPSQPAALEAEDFVSAKVEVLVADMVSDFVASVVSSALSGLPTLEPEIKSREEPKTPGAGDWVTDAEQQEQDVAVSLADLTLGMDDGDEADEEEEEEEEGEDEEDDELEDDSEEGEELSEEDEDEELSEEFSEEESEEELSLSDEESEELSEEEDSRSEESDSDSDSDWRDTFPFEQNLFALSKSYAFIKRVSTCGDAVVYKARSLMPHNRGELVAIKIKDWCASSRRTGKHPLEVRLLASAQPGPNGEGEGLVSKMICWHALNKTKCHAIVTAWQGNDSLEKFLFLNIRKTRIYMQHVLYCLMFLQRRGIFYRDLKPSNVLWDDKECRACMIDFDVSTFFQPILLHNRHVGTMGFMGPEIEAIHQEKKALRREKKKLAAGKGYDMRADMYSCGVLLGCLLFSVEEGEVGEEEKDPRSAWGMKRATVRIQKEGYGSNNYCTYKLSEDYYGCFDENGDYSPPDADHFDPKLVTDCPLSEAEKGCLMEGHKLLMLMLEDDPDVRITPEQALEHAFFTMELDPVPVDIAPPSPVPAQVTTTDEAHVEAEAKVVEPAITDAVETKPEANAALESGGLVAALGDPSPVVNQNEVVLKDEFTLTI